LFGNSLQVAVGQTALADPKRPIATLARATDRHPGLSDRSPPWIVFRLPWLPGRQVIHLPRHHSARCSRPSRAESPRQRPDV